MIKAAKITPKNNKKSFMKGPTEKGLCKLFYKMFQFYQVHDPLFKDIYLIHIANQQYTNMIYSIELKRQGLRKGVADYLGLFLGGDAIFIEFKRTSKSKQSESQVEFQRECERLGFHYYLEWEPERAIEILRHHAKISLEKHKQKQKSNQ